MDFREQIQIKDDMISIQTSYLIRIEHSLNVQCTYCKFEMETVQTGTSFIYGFPLILVHVDMPNARN